MRILIDINHPAHVHMFKNFINIFEKKGNFILITANKKECVEELLRSSKFNFIIIGKKYRNIFGKILGLILRSCRLLIISYRYKPDMFLSHASISAAVVSKLFRKPNISFEDTPSLEQLYLYKLFMYKFFTDAILSPECLKLDLGKRHIKFKGYKASAYLHPKCFSPDENVLELLGVKKGEKFIIIRFSEHAATHDIGYDGISFENKMKCIEEFGRYGKVFVSSEANSLFSEKEIKTMVPAHKMHDAIYYADLVYSEGATTASEASLLGTPAIYISSKILDYLLDKEIKYRTLFNFCGSLEDQENSIKLGVELLKKPGIKEEWKLKAKKIFDDTIDVTSFLVWFVENYPKSFCVMKSNPEFQLEFK